MKEPLELIPVLKDIKSVTKWRKDIKSFNLVSQSLLRQALINMIVLLITFMFFLLLSMKSLITILSVMFRPWNF